jgi:glutamate synthase (NADPH/NADH) large chain
MLLIDMEEGRIISDEELKSRLAAKPSLPGMAGAHPAHPGRSAKPVEPRALRKDVSLLDRQQAFGYTQEDTKILMAPMAMTGQEAIGSMGTDTPISVMSRNRSCSTPISSRTSPRSPTRRSIRSAKSW